MSDIEEANRSLEKAKNSIALWKEYGTYYYFIQIEKHVTDTLVVLENIKEKTCTLTWREDGTALADCSNCGEGQLYNDYNYCPNCGAKNINPGREPPADLQEGATFLGDVIAAEAYMSNDPCGDCDRFPGNQIECVFDRLKRVYVKYDSEHCTEFIKDCKGLEEKF